MNFLEIKSTKNLAEYCGISYEILARWTYGPTRNQLYRKFEIQKKSGGTRVILSPDKNLGKIQRKIADELKNHYHRHRSAYGFVDNFSIVDNAYQHINSKWVLNLDLEDFFPSIHFGRIRGMLLKPPFNFTEKVAQWIAQLVTFEKMLPQGAPSSPILSNMICLRLDRDLKRLAQRYDLIYSRYADDITLSTNRNFPDVIARLENKGEGKHVTLGDALISTINNNGFEIKDSKTRLLGSSQRQEVTGIVVNEKCNLPRQYLNKIRGEIGRLRYIDGEEHKKLYRKVLGRIGHLKKVVGEFDARYLKLKARLHGIKLTGHRTPEVFFRATAWILENEETGDYGTAHYIKELGWITAKHVVNINQLGSYRLFHPDAPAEKHVIQLKSNWFDDDIDYIFLNSKAKPITSLKIAISTINNGESCIIVGYPNYLKNNSEQAGVRSRIKNSHFC